MSGSVVLLIATALVAVSAAATTSLLRPEGRIDACIGWGVMAIVNIVGALLLVGVLGLLRPGPLLAAHGVTAIVLVTLLARRGWPHLKIRTLRPRFPIRRAPWELAIVGLAALALGWQLLVALVLPPYAHDALTYHLTSVAT